MELRKILKAKNHRKDYEKKRNLLREQNHQIKNGSRKSTSIQFPKNKKYLPKKVKK